MCFPPCALSDDEKMKAFGLVWTDLDKKKKQRLCHAFDCWSFCSIAL